MIRNMMWLLAMLLVLGPFSSLSAGTYNPFASAMSAMADAMSDFANRSLRNQRQGPGGWRSSREDYDDLIILYRNMPGAPPRSPASKTQLLDGIWLGRYGEVIMIRDGFFRIYTYSYNHYEDGLIELRGPIMRIKGARTGNSKDYEYVHRNNRMVLRDGRKHLMPYKRLRLNNKSWAGSYRWGP